MKYFVEYHYGTQYYKELVEAESPFAVIERERDNAFSSLAPVVREKRMHDTEWANIPDFTNSSQFQLVICSEADEEEIAEWNSKMEQST